MAEKESVNCKDRCYYSRLCHQKGWDDLNPEDCAWYYKLDDLMNEARYERDDDYDPDDENEEDEE